MKLRRVFIKGGPEWDRVKRGGSWYNDASSLRAVFRSFYNSALQGSYIGARLYRAKGGKDEA
jgi:formylglycine-generating enzyme required for sulfatase activity